MTATVGVNADQVRIVPLGGLGEIGLNLMVLECGGEAIIVDAGVMFGQDRVLGGGIVAPRSCPPRAQPARDQGHHRDSRARGPHRGNPASDPALSGADFRQRGHDRFRPPPAQSGRDRGCGRRRPARDFPARAVSVGTVHRRSDSRHPFDTRLVCARDHDSGRAYRPHRRLQDRSASGRRPAFRSRAIRRARRARRRAAAFRFDQCRAARPLRLRELAASHAARNHRAHAREIFPDFILLASASDPAGRGAFASSGALCGSGRTTDGGKYAARSRARAAQFSARDFYRAR